MNSNNSGAPRRNPRRGTSGSGSQERSPSPSKNSSPRKRAPDVAPDVKDSRTTKKLHVDEGSSPSQLEGLAVELCSLRQALQHFVSGLDGVSNSVPSSGGAGSIGGGSIAGSAVSSSIGRSIQSSSSTLQCWGELRSSLDGTVYRLNDRIATVGRSVRCNVVLPDALIPSMMARLRSFHEGPSIECLAGIVSVNGVELRKSERSVLSSNDSVKFIGTTAHEFTFVPAAKPSSPTTTTTATAAAPNPSGTFAQTSPLASELEDIVLDPRKARYSSRPFLYMAPNATPTSSNNKNNNNSNNNNTPLPPNAESKLLSLKEEFVQKVVGPQNIKSSFESFRYHLSDPTKQILLNTVGVFLKDTTVVPVVASLGMSAAIVLDGPFGTELYQVELVNALAKELSASVLHVESPHPVLVPDPNHAAAAEEDPVPSRSFLSGLLRKPWVNSLSGSDVAQKKVKFKRGDRVRYVGPAKPDDASRGPEVGMVGEVVLVFEDDAEMVGVGFDQPIGGGGSFAGACEDGHGFFVNMSTLRQESEDRTVFELQSAVIDSIFEVASAHAPCIVCFHDIEGVAFASYSRYKKFQTVFQNLPERVVVIGLRSNSPPTPKGRVGGSLGERPAGRTPGSTSLMEFSFLDHMRRDDSMMLSSSSSVGSMPSGMVQTRASRMLKKMLPVRVSISAPPRNPELAEWKRMMDEDVKAVKIAANRAQINRALEQARVKLDVNAVDTSLLQTDILSSEAVEQALGWAFGFHARRGGSFVSLSADHKASLSVEALNHALLLQRQSEESMQGGSSSALRNVVTENEFEKKILADVVPADELNVTFQDIGALDSVKNTLRELVMLPLTRPELFRKGNLTKPTKGVLLFGPPGTGKTMLAKAVATECRANFLNVSMASIASKWFGEGEKFAQAIFTVASKISPAVIFIDEVDSLLGKREKNGEHEAMRKIKNTIMSMWDGLKSSDNERVIVLAATNRPFDLDDAVLRRLPRRMLVDLPDAKQREQVLRVICQKEELEQGFDFGELAKETDGYSGSDLKNLCVAAAYQPIKEILEAERASGLDPYRVTVGDPTASCHVRPLRLSDFLAAKEQVSVSVSEDAASISELRQWNEMYGEGGSRTKETLPYFM